MCKATFSFTGEDAENALVDEEAASNIVLDPVVEGIPNVRDSIVFQIMKERCKSSYMQYVKTFEGFCKKYNITEDSPPSLENLEVNQSEIDKKYSIVKSYF